MLILSKELKRLRGENSMLKQQLADVIKKHDELVERSVLAMAVAEREPGWKTIDPPCPMVAAVKALQQRLADAERDSERLDFLIKTITETGGVFYLVNMSPSSVENRRPPLDRASIDAAIATEKGKQ